MTQNNIDLETAVFDYLKDRMYSDLPNDLRRQYGKDELLDAISGQIELVKAIGQEDFIADSKYRFMWNPKGDTTFIIYGYDFASPSKEITNPRGVYERAVHATRAMSGTPRMETFIDSQIVRVDDKERFGIYHTKVGF